MSSFSMFRKILIANRGEIACRVMRTAKRCGIQTVAVFSDSDRNALHVQMADEAFHIGKSEPTESYLNIKKIIDVARDTNAEGIHPGYGFLSENAHFAEACETNKITFIGPSSYSMKAMASKSAAKILMENAGVPVVPGYHGESQSYDQIEKEIERIGFPVLIKAVLGGGGKGMRIVENISQLKDAINLAQREAAASFGDSRILVEKYIRKPRHIEVQVFSDKHDNHVYLWDRDCSVQRRYQKIIEEAPAPGLSDELRKEMGTAATNVARAVKYTGAGTVEFIVDRETDKFYFMEMNTRLQVEHPVTEMITGQDLVLWQLQVACGHPLPLKQTEIPRNGHAVESRIYAENPSKNFMPGSGTISYLRTPPVHHPHVRVDTGIREGDTVSVFYDPMIAKLIVWDVNRERAMQQMRKALNGLHVGGLNTNIPFLRKLTSNQSFLDVDIDTGFIPRHKDYFFPPASPTPDQYFAIAALSSIVLSDLSTKKTEKPVASLDPWNYIHSKRINHVGSKVFKYTDPNLLTDSAATEGKNDADVEVVVDILSDSTFNVTVQRENHPPNQTHHHGHHGHHTHHLHKTKFDGLTAKVNTNGEIEVFFGSKREICGFHQKGNSIDLFLLDDQVHLLAQEPNLGSADGSSSGSLNAPVTGQVKKVNVKKGDHVKKGDSLIVMSAMKMEFLIHAPYDGEVESVLCVEGVTVNENHQVVKLLKSDTK